MADLWKPVPRGIVWKSRWLTYDSQYHEALFEKSRWLTYESQDHEAEVERAGKLPLWSSLVRLPLFNNNLWEDIFIYYYSYKHFVHLLIPYLRISPQWSWSHHQRSCTCPAGLSSPADMRHLTLISRASERVINVVHVWGGWNQMPYIQISTLFAFSPVKQVF